MPTYEYEVVLPDGSGGERFEVVQPMRDDALTEHPETGEPVRRVISAPNVGGKHSAASEKNQLSDKNLDRLGFTKYVRGDKGYEKTAGSGPERINKE